MLRTQFIRQARTFTTYRVLNKTVIDTGKDALKKVDRVAADAAIKGIETGEAVTQTIKETAQSVTSSASKATSQAQGSASEAAGKAKGAASEVAGDAKGKAYEVKGEANSKMS